MQLVIPVQILSSIMVLAACICQLVGVESSAGGHAGLSGRLPSVSLQQSAAWEDLEKVKLLG